MSPGFSSLDSAEETSSDGTMTSASISPATDSVLYVVIAGSHATSWPGSETYNVSGLGGTWEQVGSSQTYGVRRNMAVFRGTKATAWGTGTLTITLTATGLQDMAYTIDEVTGVDPSNPDDTAVQGAASNSLALADVGVVNADDGVFVAGGHEDGANNFDCTGYTGITTLGSLSNIRQIRSFYDITSPDETPDLTSDGGGNGIGGIGFIVNGEAIDAPTVRSVSAGSQGTGDPRDVVLPSTIEDGDLVLVHLIIDGDNGVAAWDNSSHGTWTELESITDGSNHGGALYAKVADGTEDGGTLSIDLTGADQIHYRCWAIQDWFGSLSGVDSAATTTSSTTTPDPPNLSPGWGELPILWLALCGGDAQGPTLISYPDDYPDNQHNATGSNAVRHASATRRLTASSENPGTFSWTSANDIYGITVAVRPASVDITDVDTDETWDDGDTGLVITGSGFV